MPFLGDPRDPHDPALGVTGVTGAAVFCVKRHIRARTRNHGEDRYLVSPCVVILRVSR